MQTLHPAPILTDCCLFLHIGILICPISEAWHVGSYLSSSVHCCPLCACERRNRIYCSVANRRLLSHPSWPCLCLESSNGPLDWQGEFHWSKAYNHTKMILLLYPRRVSLDSFAQCEPSHLINRSSRWWKKGQTKYSRLPPTNKSKLAILCTLILQGNRQSLLKMQRATKWASWRNRRRCGESAGSCDSFFFFLFFFIIQNRSLLIFIVHSVDYHSVGEALEGVLRIAAYRNHRKYPSWYRLLGLFVINLCLASRRLGGPALAVLVNIELCYVGTRSKESTWRIMSFQLTSPDAYYST